MILSTVNLICFPRSTRLLSNLDQTLAIGSLHRHAHSVLREGVEAHVPAHLLAARRAPQFGGVLPGESARQLAP